MPGLANAGERDRKAVISAVDRSDDSEAEESGKVKDFHYKKEGSKQDR